MSRRVLLTPLCFAWWLGLLAGCVPGHLVQDSDRPTVPAKIVANPPGPNPLPPEPPATPDANLASGTISPYRARTVDPQPIATDPPAAPVSVTPAPDAVNPASPPATESTTQASEPARMPTIISGDSAVVAAESALLAAFKALREKKSEEEVRRALEKVEPGDLDLLLQMLRLSSRLGDPASANRLTPQQARELLQKVETLSGNLRRRAPLQLHLACFCRKIKAFGVYEALPANPSFEAGVRRLPGEHVLVYVEVRNFASRECGRQLFESSLSSRLEIQECRLLRRHGDEPADGSARGNASGASETSPRAPGRAPVEIHFRMRPEDRFSQTPRQDFFLGLGFNVPHNLPPGSYRLRVEVRDDIGLDPATGKPRVAETTLDFQVRGNGCNPPGIPLAETASGKAE